MSCALHSPPVASIPLPLASGSASHSRRHLQRERLARARLPQQPQRLSRHHFKRHTAQHVAFVESNPYVCESYDCGSSGLLRGGRQKILSPRYKASFVKNKSAPMIITDATTTACVVARPTPCVPPRTFTRL